MLPRHRAGALAAALIAIAAAEGVQLAKKNPIETRKEPSRFAEQRKAEAEAKRKRRAEKRMRHATKALPHHGDEP